MHPSVLILTSRRSSWQQRQVAVAELTHRPDRSAIEDLLDYLITSVEPNAEVCEPIRRHGTAEDGEQLWEWMRRQDWARVPEGVFHVLGYLGVEDCSRALWTQARGSEVHSRQRAACFGLAHLRCDDIRRHIDREIRLIIERPLFQEHVPMLASKTGSGDLARAMLEAGSGHVSTDCSGGLLLGLALMNEKQLFRQVVLDPSWEATGSGTGSRGATLLGLQALGESLVTWWRSIENKTPYVLEVFTGVVSGARLGSFGPLRFVPPWAETPAQLHAGIVLGQEGLWALIHELAEPRRARLRREIVDWIDRYGFAVPGQDGSVADG